MGTARGHAQGTLRPSLVPWQEHVWSLDETLLKVPPKLILQVWDNDKFKADDLLGERETESLVEGDNTGTGDSHWGQGVATGAGDSQWGQRAASGVWGQPQGTGDSAETGSGHWGRGQPVGTGSSQCGQGDPMSGGKHPLVIRNSHQ